MSEHFALEEMLGQCRAAHGNEWQVAPRAEMVARVEQNKPIVDGVKDDRGYAHLRQLVDDVDIIDRTPQIYRGSPVECPDTLKLDKRFELLGRSGGAAITGPGGLVIRFDLDLAGLFSVRRLRLARAPCARRDRSAT